MINEFRWLRPEDDINLDLSIGTEVETETEEVVETVVDTDTDLVADLDNNGEQKQKQPKQSKVYNVNNNSNTNSNISTSPYPCNNSISNKIHLFFGEAWKLPVDAIIIGQNETFKERTDGNESIFTLAGPEFEHAVIDLERTSTGTSAIVEGGTLGCKNVILSVGPKYDKKYINASISALHSAYRSAFNVSYTLRTHFV